MQHQKRFDFESWAGQIQKVSAFLDTVIKDREQDFLNLGQELHEISSKSSGLYNMAGQLTDLAGGEKIIKAQTDLRQKLDDINTYCDVTWGEKSADLLAGVLEQSSSLVLQMNDFKKIVRTLNVLSFTTRIESARLGELGRGFMTLADDVESLGSKMMAHWQRIIDESSTLFQLVDSARIRVRELVGDQKTGVGMVLEDINSNLGYLEDIRLNSKQASEEMEEKAGQISSGFREMVSSMQFHDITRQIIEHVQETLDEVLSLIRQNSDPVEGGDQDFTEQVAGWINRVCHLQIRQMDQAGSSFFKAVDSLKNNLDSVAGNVSGMTDSLKKSLGMGDDRQDNLLATTGSKISQVKSCINQFADQSREIGKIMQTVGKSVSQMSSFVNDIEEVGSEIELIALNASVRAAHTGSEGLALGVVAVAIQQLSGRAREKTGVVTQTLKRIAEDSGQLNELTSRAMDFSGFDRISSGIDTTLTELQDLDARTGKMISEILGTGRELAETARHLGDNLGIHHEVIQELDQAKGLLSKIVRETEAGSGNDFENMEWPENLRRMFDRYTMESQRLVHKIQLDGQAEPEQDAQSPEQADDQESLGDNIELF
ncbi:methyl-accepting chemotaxis protein [Desulfonatronovibrio hydrogenovorans]|uniref:methyl-accepting chemotaxis protein n=1 Tax=Desulfonatronovibrio hydrogenovorans TaxID=53245 RepID=UPI00048D1F8D|nr:methyl-accepting chemotaxis protein [Desulfonatronovibrio hydrogenovorans]